MIKMDIDVDVLIAGSGVSGLYCALNLRADLKVLVLSKSKITETNTYLAQGGISTAKNEEDIPHFIEDTLKAGQYKNSLEAVTILAKESMRDINKLIEFGMPFDKISEKFSYTKEGAHSINRIVHSKDHTGQVVAETLINETKKRKNITIYENTFLVDILKLDNKCIGGILLKDNEQINVYSKVVILATGGIGGLFNNSTNQRKLTGDGLAIAIKNNIKLKDINYIQFHPTAFYEENNKDRRLLISEAVRGEGGKLLNSKGERFVNELLPRNIVTKAIMKEINESKIPFVRLDITFLGEEFIKFRFPSIYNECLNKGIDITKEPIPVSPAQHYFEGGIQVDVNSMTSMNNLYAVGETSCTGVHGANRLASNSLLEGLVFSRRAAENINKNIDNISNINIKVPKLQYELDEIQCNNRKIVVNELMRRSNELNAELFNS
ncbi:L-aspartate oxidase [Clostridium sp. USBA 49]|nr:L-aspartate oxidase [Clostridium sp. USBA 49]